VYLGYGYLGNNAFNPNTGGLNGLQAAAHVHWARLVGVELDVSHYGFGGDAIIQHTTTVLVRPRVTISVHGIHLFVHGLAGSTRPTTAARSSSPVAALLSPSAAAPIFELLHSLPGG
jgi:hypothetical protein